MDERILVVEDERELNRMVCDFLAYSGFSAAAAYDGREAVEALGRESFDLVVLDLMLPGMDGLEVARSVRSTSAVPIIMLTARSEEADKIAGLEIGADDYLTKPFSMKELTARIRAVLRRSATGARGVHGAGSGAPAGRGDDRDEPALRYRDLALDPSRRTVTVGDRTPRFTHAQFEILRKLMSEPGRVFTRLQLLEGVQEQAYEGYERTIDVHIKNIRKLLEAGGQSPAYIATVRGVGYKLADRESAP